MIPARGRVVGDFDACDLAGFGGGDQRAAEAKRGFVCGGDRAQTAQCKIVLDSPQHRRARVAGAEQRIFGNGVGEIAEAPDHVDPRRIAAFLAAKRIRVFADIDTKTPRSDRDHIARMQRGGCARRER